MAEMKLLEVLTQLKVTYQYYLPNSAQLEPVDSTGAS